MLRELKFVQGAVAKKDLLPAMTHFKIEGGFVRGFNGSMAISSPIAFDIDCNPRADQLVKAITQCNETVTLSVTPAGKLRVQSGKFRAFVELIEGPTMHPEPEGEVVHFDGETLLAACKTLQDFIGNDASRLWTNGILLKGASAFATNNVCLLEYWLGTEVPFVVNVPRACVNELVRINEAPTHAQLTTSSISFHFTDGRWIRSQLLNTDWPDLSKILNKPSNPKPIPDELFDGLEKLMRMADGGSRIYFKDGIMRTHLEEQQGGTYEMEGLDFEGCYNIAIMSLLKGVVTSADFTLYPDAALFFGERLRGAIIGMRM